MFLCSFISIILYTLVVCQPNTLTTTTTQPPTSIPPSTYFLQANTTNSNSTTTNNSTTTMSPTPQTSNHTTTIPHSVLCGPCDKGSHRPANKLTHECTADCPVAGQCRLSHLTCIPCDEGTYAPQRGMADCFPCVNGTVAKDKGTVECSPCDKGQTNNDEWTKCVDCHPGHFNAFNASICSPCPIGQNTTNFGSLACEKCPMGTFTNENGTALCEECGAGFYGILRGATSREAACVTCPEGFYCPDGATIDPQPCLADYYCPAGSASAQSCPALYGSQPLAIHCAPTTTFYIVIGGCIVGAILVIVGFAVRAWHNRSHHERQPLLSTPATPNSPQTLVYQGL